MKRYKAFTDVRHVCLVELWKGIVEHCVDPDRVRQLISNFHNANTLYLSSLIMPATVYITEISSKSGTITAFEERNLKGQEPTTVASCGMIVFPSVPVDTPFLRKINNIQTTFKAAIQTRAIVGTTSMSNVAKLITTFPVVPPTIMVDVRDIADDNQDMFKSLGLREEVALDFPGQWLLSSNMTQDQLRALWKTGVNIRGPALAGNTNPAGLLAFYYSWKVIAMFTIAIGMRENESAEYFFTTMDKSETFKGVNKLPADVLTKRRELLMKAADSKTDMVDVGNIWSEGDFEEVYMPMTSRATASRYWMESDDNFGRKGFVFPFFNEMLRGDKDFVAGVFFRYFSKCIADTPEELAGLAPILRKGFVALQHTNQGKAIQHIFFGIQSCIETGGKFAPIIEAKQYRGFVLLGEEARLLWRGEVKEPGTIAEVRASLDEMRYHENAVKKIVDLLEGMDKDKGIVNAVDREKALISSRYLANEIHKRKVPSVEERMKELGVLLPRLQYGQEFWSVDNESVKKLVVCLMTGQIDEKEPFYMGGDYCTSDNQYIRILSVFGPKAPTLSVSTGDKTFTIANTEAVDPNLTEKEGKRAVPFLPIYLRSLEGAADSWDQLKRMKRVRIYGAKQKGRGKFADRSKDVGHIAGKDFDLVYTNLRQWCHSAGSKRKVGESSVEEVLEAAERVAKKKVTDATVVNMF